MAQAKKHALHIDSHDLIENGFLIFREARHTPFNAGIIVEAINRAEAILRSLHIGCDIGGFRDISGAKQGCCAKGGCQSLTGRSITVHNHDLAAACHKTARHRSANTIGAACHNASLA